MTFDVDDIIHSTCDAVVTLAVPLSSVTREVEAQIRSVVCIKEPLMIIVYGSGHTRCGPANAQSSLHVVA